MRKRLYIGLTKRKGDRFALAIIGLLLLAQLAQVVYALGYVNDDNMSEFVWKPQLILNAILVYFPPFLVAYAGLIFYLVRDKDVLPKRPMFYSKNKAIATCFSVVYFIALLIFFGLSLLIAPDYSGGWPNNADSNIIMGAIITIVIGLPVDLLGLYIWYRNYGVQENKE